MSMSPEHLPLPALVARPGARADERPSYLQLTALGLATWTGDPRAATAFDSMREATRAAFRLPGALRAYGLPLSVELTLAQVH